LHVDMLEHVTPVPNTHPSVDGVVFSRGQVVPAINLRTRFGLPREAPTSRTRLLFVTWEDRTVALIVDSAREFRAIPADAVRPIEDELAGISGHYLRGLATVNNRPVLLLDVGAVLEVSQIPLPEEVGATPAS